MTKATMTAGSVGMEKAELRHHITIARRGAPVHVAFALGGDGKAVVMMDKRKPPRAIEKELKEGARDSKNHRFGVLSFDQDEPSLARFMVNKPSSGMAKKLIVALKGTGVRKIELTLEDGTAVESAQGEEDEDASTYGLDASGASGEAAVAAQYQSDAEYPAEQDADSADALFQQGSDASNGVNSALDAADSGADDQDAPASQSFQDPDQEPDLSGDPAEMQLAPDAEATAAPDVGALARDLTGLVKQMLAVIAKDPSQKAALVELATDAQASVKRGDLQQAAAGIEVLRQAVLSCTGDAVAAASPDPARAGGDPASGAPAKAALERYRKSHAVWMATRAKVDAEIVKLRGAIMAADHGGAFDDTLEQAFFSTIDPVLSTLDDSLADTLAQAGKATDVSEADKLMQSARTAIGRYSQFVATSQIIVSLDNNPFVPIAIGKTLTGSLSALAGALR